MRLGLVVETVNGRLWDLSGRARGVRFSTNGHGYESLQATVPLERVRWEPLGWRNATVSVLAQGLTVWRGRVEDVRLTDGGVAIAALGPWRALDDMPYTELWSYGGVSRWQPVDGPGYERNEKYEMDQEERLFIAPRKNETFTATGGGTEAGVWGVRRPHNATRDIITVSFDYEFLAPAPWEIRLSTYTGWGFSGNALDWSLAGTGALLTGSVTRTLAGFPAVAFWLYPQIGSGTTAYAGETGDVYVKFTNVRVKTTSAAVVSADVVAADILDQVTTLNDGLLDDDAGLLAATGLDLTEVVYEEASPLDVLRDLARLGNSSDEELEVGVFERLFLRPVGEQATWYVDAADVQLEQSLDDVTNAVYAVYKTTVDDTAVRTATATDAASVDGLALTRKAAVSVETTATATAEQVRDSALAGGTDRRRARLTVRRSVKRRVSMRAGDTVVVRNAPLLWGVEGFVIGRTEYDADGDVLTLESRDPLPALEMLLARGVS